jgi:8-oxo-dGTP diphosphatase
MGFQPSHCQYCGTELEEKHAEGKERPYCPSCDRILWQNAEPVAAVVLRRGDEILFVKRGIEPGKGEWSLPAGFLEYEEEPDQAAARELEEETGLRVEPSDLEIFETMNIERFPGQRLVALVFSVNAEKASGEISAGDDAEDSRFWTLEELEASDETLRQHFVSAMRHVLKES